MPGHSAVEDDAEKLQWTEYQCCYRPLDYESEEPPPTGSPVQKSSEYLPMVAEVARDGTIEMTGAIVVPEFHCAAFRTVANDHRGDHHSIYSRRSIVPCSRDRQQPLDPSLTANLC